MVRIGSILDNKGRKNPRIKKQMVNYFPMQHIVLIDYQ